MKEELTTTNRPGRGEGVHERKSEWEHCVPDGRCRHRDLSPALFHNYFPMMKEDLCRWFHATGSDNVRSDSARTGLTLDN